MAASGKEYVFLNDGLVPSEQAHVSISDAGLLHGVGLFETMRSYSGKVFRVADHVGRLEASAAALHVGIGHSSSEIIEAIDSLLEANDLRDARLRLTLTGGSVRQVGDEQRRSGSLFITAGAIEPYPQEFYERGMTVIVSSFKHNPAEPTVGHKTLNYFGRLLALQDAQRKQAGEALWFTPTNLLAEGCVSNVFLVRDNKVLTPGLDTGALPGITRQVVLELAEQNDIECQQCNLNIKDLLAASEVFLTNSIMELMPVCRVERHGVGDEKPGPVYRQLHELYRQAIFDTMAPQK